MLNSTPAPTNLSSLANSVTLQLGGIKNASSAVYAMVGTTQLVLAYQAQSMTFMWKILRYPGPVAGVVVCLSFGDGTPLYSKTQPHLLYHRQLPKAQFSQTFLLAFKPPYHCLNYHLLPLQHRPLYSHRPL